MSTLHFVSIEDGTGTKIIPATLAPSIQDVAWTGKHGADDLQNNYRVWNSLADINDLVDVNGKGRKFGGYSNRQVDRMIASFKYIVTLLTGKPY